MSKSIETYSPRNPRLLVFHGIIFGLVAVLIGGMAFRQLLTTAIYSERERRQNQRRVIAPAPRGNIYDRDGKIIVGNRPRFSVVLDLANLRSEFRGEYSRIRRNFSVLPSNERPNSAQIAQIARTSVAQRYLDQVNRILNRNEKVDGNQLNRHINQALLLPYTLLDELQPEEYARLLERLPVNAPVQVYTSSTRHYPYGSAAAHTLGYIGTNTNPDVADFPGEDLQQFKMKGTVGRAGLEEVFDDQLQGINGAAIYLVDHAGYKIDTPLESRKPQQGEDLRTSIDIELQLAAEEAMKGRSGAAVALDIRTGEVLVLASKPDYNTSTLRPNLPPDADIEASGYLLNRAIQGQYPPGSTFKVITAIAALRAGAFSATDKVVCPGYYMVGGPNGRRAPCWNRHGHGERDIVGALRDSCNVFFYKYGLEIGPELIAAEARRFGSDHPTGIELPYEFSKSRVADPAWKLANLKQRWFAGDTANISIGQGDTLITPLQAACMIASFARGQTETKPTLIHNPDRPTQRTTPIGLTPSDYNLVLRGMEQCYQFGTGRLARVEGLSAAAKSGTAQKGKIELAWLVAFAPAENPQIAVAVVLEGDEGQNFGGGTHAGPVVHSILKTWKEKRERPAPAATTRTGFTLE